MRIELYKRGRGFLLCSEEAEQVHARMAEGEIGWFKPIRIRDITEHRRYWKLLTVLADNCERIELPYGGFMLIRSKEDVHIAMKICTGHVDIICDADGKPLYQIPKPTNFEDMEQSEWEAYWPRVVDVVCERILPGVRFPEVELEMQKLLRIAA